MTDNTKWLLGSYRPQKTVCRLIKKEFTENNKKYKKIIKYVHIKRRMAKILKKKFKNVLTKRTNDGIIRPSKRSREKTKRRNQKIRNSFNS